ncbi:hypothetical protein [Streptococcus uberis]|uniref:hypothetical protein n=1 Tax=Streptococcus uberis TaxID=1349 RepID=UPI003EF46576
MNEDTKLARDLLENNWIILGKNGIIHSVKGVEYGAVTVHYRNGEPWKYTRSFDTIIE